MVAELPKSVSLSNYVLPNGLRLSVLHLETVSSFTAQGNKLFKLYNWLSALQQGTLSKDRPWVTFGGAWSNHLLAVAQVGQELGIATIGLVRGPQPTQLNNTLTTCLNAGMELLFLERTEYRELASSDKIPHQLAKLNPVFIPEGGRSKKAVEGAALIGQFIPHGTKTVILAAGTGTTAAGILSANSEVPFYVWALAPFAKPEFLNNDIAALGLNAERLQFLKVFSTAGHFGGFGKVSPALLKFISESKQDYKIELDPVYTAKAWHWLQNLDENEFPEQPAVFIHTGGLRPGGHY